MIFDAPITLPLMLALVLVLDAAIGEPRWLWTRVPHPVVAMGGLISWLDQRLNKGAYKRVAGVGSLIILLLVTGAIAVGLSALPHGWVIETVVGAILLAHRSLVSHVGAVSDGLGRNLEDGRTAVSMIVGRDPDALDMSGVSRAAIESAAENFSDGVVAPAFWFLLAGLPGIALYKAINTADSMIGYRTDRHLAFGWASARLDDLVNLIPARLTGFLFCLTGGGLRAAMVMWRDAGLHRSPNAGWPEAAMAATLGIALSGPRAYPGQTPVDDPYIHPEGRRDLTADDVRRAVVLLWRAWGVMFLLASTAGAVVMFLG
ncbi:MAG: adenosylcobinamide-phosphate synthase CbiB [Pseudomonadota bacterium]